MLRVTLLSMSDVSQLLSALAEGDRQAGNRLLPLVYDELRKLAAARLRQEPPGQTLEATALVHEAYLRLIGPQPEHAPEWEGRGHFFAAAAEAMRRILVDNARRKKRLRHGGDLERQELDEDRITAAEVREDLLGLDEALTRLAATDRAAADLVQLRYFAGLSIPEVAKVLDISPRTADRLWSYARAWLHHAIAR